MAKVEIMYSYNGDTPITVATATELPSRKERLAYYAERAFNDVHNLSNPSASNLEAQTRWNNFASQIVHQIVVYDSCVSDSELWIFSDGSVMEVRGDPRGLQAYDLDVRYTDVEIL